MCGIAGAVWNSMGDPLARNVLEKMTSVLGHRGPDGSGHHYENKEGHGVAFGHRRLAIIDLAGGHQPLSNEDGSVWITFNGEIYNYRELRTRLEAKGHQFRTNSDTETIVHLYEDEGVNCVDHLRGMFAFAIWDSRKKSLFLARDRMGQKPLVYRHEKGRCLFSSEIKSLLQVPDVPRELDPIALNEYLTYLYVPHPRTMFKGIHKLPPAHYAIYQNDRVTVRRYWMPEYNTVSTDNVDELSDRLRHELREAVKLRMRSDVPLGAFLSGGIDSAVIAGSMQECSSTPVQTYTIGFPIAKYDETHFAKQTADHLGTNHREFQVQPDSFAILPNLIWHYDEPFGDSSAIPTYYVSKLTREHVKVALTGDGADELFGGYPRYETVRQTGSIGNLKFLRKAAACQLWQKIPVPNREDSVLRRLQKRLEMLGVAPSQRYANWVTYFDQQHRRSLYSDDFSELLGEDRAVDFFVAAIDNCHSACAGTRAMAADLQSYLPCDLLAKVDIASMAHGLECRSPFLDHHVVEFALTIPYKYKISGAITKSILKNTFKNFVPPPVASAAKRGFSIPLDDWFRKDHRKMIQEVLLDSSSLERGYFRPQAIESLIKEHISGQWNHGQRLWALLCLELWQRMFVDQWATAGPPRATMET